MNDRQMTWDEVVAENAILRKALQAGYMLHRGRACIRASKDIPMEITDPKRERVIRAALL